MKDAYLIYKEPVKYTLISISSAVIDVGIFTILYNIFTNILLDILGVKIISALSNVIARISSGALNFTMNKIIAFRSGGNTKKQLLQYLLLFTTQMCVSTLLVPLASSLPINITIAKIIIDVTIFFVNYFVQKRFIFNTSRTSTDNK